jgi:hypothetical protein
MEYNTGSNHYLWKGDKVSYKVLHKWVRRWLLKPEFCNRCKLVPPIDASNNSGLYKRDLTDWEWLCRKCHVNKDWKPERFVNRRIRYGAEASRWKGGISKDKKLYMSKWQKENREKVNTYQRMHYQKIK